MGLAAAARTAKSGDRASADDLSAASLSELVSRVAAVAMARGEIAETVSGATWPTAPVPSLEALRTAAAALRADPAAAVDRLGRGAPLRDREVLADPDL